MDFLKACGGGRIIRVKTRSRMVANKAVRKKACADEALTNCPVNNF